MDGLEDLKEAKSAMSNDVNQLDALYQEAKTKQEEIKAAKAVTAAIKAKTGSTSSAS